MSITIIELEKNVSCLPGFEKLDTASISKRLPKKRHLKSSKELQFEKDRREGKVLKIA